MQDIPRAKRQHSPRQRQQNATLAAPRMMRGDGIADSAGSTKRKVYF